MSKQLTIYGHYVSQPSRAVLWILKLQNIDFKYVELNPSTGETRTPEFLKKFPSHTIPAMECDGICIAESGAILLFLAEKFGWDDLYPKDAKIRAEINQYLFYHTVNTRQCTLVHFRPQLVFALTGKKLEPSKNELGMFKETLRTLENLLSRGDYIVSDRLTFADISCYCEIDQLLLGDSLFDFSAYPNILKWAEKMKKVPLHDEVHLPLLKMLTFLKKKNQSKL